MPLTDIPRPASPTFIVTKEYRRFAEFCAACHHQRYIGLCYGPPGVGKTESARHYAQWALFEGDRRIDRAPPISPDVLACQTLFYTPTVTNTPLSIGRDVQTLRNTLRSAVEEATHRANGEDDYVYDWQWPDPTELIIVDEADRLKMAGLEQMRDIYDRSHIGLVLIGMPGIEKRLARYPQLYSRVGFVHPFHALSPDELRFILEQKWQQFGLAFNPTDFTDTEALAAIVRITHGNFRLVQRLFGQIERILQINQQHTITKEVVEIARESLVIGLT